MRSLFLPLIVGLLAPASVSAQEPRAAPELLGFAAGLARSGSAEGLTARLSYAPLGVERLLTLRLEAGFRWTPTYRFWAGGPLIWDNAQVGEARGADISVGATAVLSPSPKARFAPYLVGGVLSVQEWYRSRSGSSQDWVRQSWSGGALHLVGGVGLRARVLGHSFQLEARRYNYTTALTVGAGFGF